jgi:ATP-dependent Clp protease ATP-binding subunit ClpC
VFERFTERARQVVVLAQEEARRLRHNYIGTEHLLLGLLREEEGLAARVLESLGVSLDAVRLCVGEIVGHGDELESGQIPFTPRAKKVLELSLRESTRMDHPSIGTEHILLGLVAEGEGVANRIMDQLGATGERIRAELIAQLSGPRASGWTSTASFEPGEEPIATRSALLELSGSRGDRIGRAAPAMLAGAATFGAGLLVGWAIWG